MTVTVFIVHFFICKKKIFYTLRVHIFARIYFRESKKFAFREDLFSRIEVFQKFHEDLFSRTRPYKVLKKKIDCVNYGD